MRVRKRRRGVRSGARPRPRARPAARRSGRAAWSGPVAAQRMTSRRRAARSIGRSSFREPWTTGGAAASGIRSAQRILPTAVGRSAERLRSRAGGVRAGGRAHSNKQTAAKPDFLPTMSVEETADRRTRRRTCARKPAPRRSKACRSTTGVTCSSQGRLRRRQAEARGGSALLERAWHRHSAGAAVHEFRTDVPRARTNRRTALPHYERALEQQSALATCGEKSRR